MSEVLVRNLLQEILNRKISWEDMPALIIRIQNPGFLPGLEHWALASMWNMQLPQPTSKKARCQFYKEECKVKRLCTADLPSGCFPTWKICIQRLGFLLVLEHQLLALIYCFTDQLSSIKNHVFLVGMYLTMKIT